MNRVAGIVVTAGILTGAAIGLAVPASAEAPSGSYTSVITNVAGSAPIGVGYTDLVTLTPCGADCSTMVVGEGVPRELHPQGNLWGGVTTLSSGGTITSTLDPATWTLTESLPSATITSTLTKNG